MSLVRATLGDVVADQMADAMGRHLDTALFYGTTPPIQENEMNENERAVEASQQYAHDRITEVSATVDAGLSQDDLDGMNEAERLALIVGAAYGSALAERDEARAQVQSLASAATALADAADAVLALDALTQGLTFAHDDRAVENLRGVVSVTRDLTQAVGSVQAPETDQKD